MNTEFPSQEYVVGASLPCHISYVISCMKVIWCSAEVKAEQKAGGRQAAAARQ